MTEQKTFRSAFNGFNRDDVVQYIEEINTKHAAELNQLRCDMQYVQDRLNQYDALVDEDGMGVCSELEEQVENQANALLEQIDRIAELERQLDAAQKAAEAAEALNAELQAKLDAAQQTTNDRSAVLEIALKESEARNAQLQAQLDAARNHADARNAELQAQLDTALAQNNQIQIQQTEELNAYRRAERVERQANERAIQINDQVTGALADATARVDDATTQIAAMTDAATQQLKQLQLAILGSKKVLEDTAAALYAIRPTEE